jgi:phage baseplate assembly protein V
MSKVYGVVVGLVIDVNDPSAAGRVKLSFPWLDESSQSNWARVATLMAGKERGSWFMPELGDEVLVAFEMGDMDHPYIVGFLWNGQDKPPKTDTKVRLLRTVNGHEIEFTDPEVAGGDKGHIQIKDAHGNVIELKNGLIKIQGVGTLQIDAPNVLIKGRPVAMTANPI